MDLMDSPAADDLRKRCIRVDLETFFRAINNGDEAVVRLFVEAGFTPGVIGPEGLPAPTVAAQAGHVGLAKFLLASGADQDAFLQSLGAGAHPTKDAWDRAQILLTSVAALLVPVVLAIIGYVYNSAQKQKELGNRLVELSVNILKVDPGSSAQPAGLRIWAMDLLERHSDVPIPGDVRSSLLKGPLGSAERT